MADTQTDALETKEALEAGIVNSYDTEEEREAARQALSAANGIDMATGLPLDEDGKPVAEPAKEPDDPDKKAKGEGEDDKDKEPTAEELLKAKEEQVTEQNKTIANLEAKEAARAAAPEIRESVEEKMKPILDKHRADDEEVEAKLKDFEEKYGEEAAAELRKETDASRAARDAQYQKDLDEQVAQAQSEREEELTGNAGVLADIRAVPELHAWREDAMAAAQGDTTKSADKFNMAVSLDNSLMHSDEFKGKSQVERFEEVTRRVKTMLGESSGAPESQEKESGKEKTEEQIAEEIRKQAAGKDLPGSLTELPGGETAKDKLNPGKLEDMDPNDILAMDMPTDKLEALAARL